MSTTTAGILFLALLIVALAAVHVPLGDYMYRVYSSDKHSRVERVIYRLIGADPKSEQSWGAYARSVLAFSAISILFLFIFQLVQGKLPLHLNDPATPMTPALAWNTAVSFVTNTNWQAYSGESTQGHLVQMAGLAVQNFVSAAVGMAVAIALVRGFARKRTGDLGNFWVDLVRGTHPHPAADLRRRRDHPDRRRRDPELPPARPGRQHARRRPADHHRRSGCQPGSDQGTRHQRRWLLQRQLRAPVREPDHVDQLGRDLPAAGDQLLAAPHVRPDGRQQEAGLRDRLGHGEPRRDQRHVHDVVPAAAPRHRSHRRRRGDGRCRAAVRHRQLGGVRRRDDVDLHRCGRFVPRLLHQPRRHDHAVQHAARRGGARRHRLRPVRHADPRGHHRVRRRPDGRSHAGIPRQEDQPARDQARRSAISWSRR